MILIRMKFSTCHGRGTNKQKIIVGCSNHRATETHGEQGHLLGSAASKASCAEKINERRITF